MTTSLLSALRALCADHSRVEPHHEDMCPLCQQADAAIAQAQSGPTRIDAARQAQTIKDLRHDLLVLALRLYSESPDTMAIETERVMRKMRPLCEAEMGIVPEPAVCPDCLGSGDGYHEGEACSACGGWGIARDRKAA